MLPLITVMVILIALPIKLYAFLTMNKQGWLTRSATTIGGEAQDGESILRQVPTIKPHAPQPDWQQPDWQSEPAV